jgi:hypothetical protein
VLIDQPEPAHLLAAGQADQLGGVHLPDVVRVQGAATLGAGAASPGGGVQSGAGEPALQGADAGQGSLGEVVAEQDADQGGPPGGVVAAHLHDGFLQGGEGPNRVGPRVGGREVVRGLLAEAPQEAADGALGEPERGGDGGGVLALLPAEAQGAAQRGGDETRHGRSSCAPRP